MICSLVLHITIILFRSAESPSETGTTCTSRETSSLETSRETPVAHYQTSTKKTTTRQNRKRSRGAMDDLEVAILSKLRAEDECDADEHFGLHVASILRTLPPRQRAYTKIEIDRLLFSAQFPEMRVHPSHHPTASYHSFPPNSYPSDSYLPSTPTAPPAANFQSLASPDPETPPNY